MKSIFSLINGIIIFFMVIVSADKNNWWKNSILYEIFIRSFKDSDGDGIGDLNGIRMKLDYFHELKIDSLYLTPFYKSSLFDMGYAIINYTEIHSSLGSMEDFENLIREMEYTGMKMIIDFVINHCSDENEWFQKSIDKIKPYDEYFIWKNAKGFNKDGKPIPPNNWKSVFGGSAWQWNFKRKQFYFHQFGRKQPDFNLRNVNVKNEIKKIIEFWIEKGVHGFRIDAPQFFFEDEQFRDEPLKNPRKQNTRDITWFDLIHIYTFEQKEIYEFIHELRLFTDQFNKKNSGIERIFVAEAYTFFNINNTLAYYGTENFKVTQYPFNFGLLMLENPLTAEKINSRIMEWMTKMPKGATPNWNIENHDRIRMADKTSKEHAATLLILIMMLPGVVYLYYGQEIGMTNGLVRPDQIKDNTLLSRDFERCPMQWDDTINAGFSSSADLFLPVDSSYWVLNVEKQKQQRNSFYTMFKNLSQLRQTETCKYGQLKTHVVSQWVYIIERVLSGNVTYYVTMNFGPEYELIDLSDYIIDIPTVLMVETSSLNSNYNHGQKIKLDNVFPNILTLKPFSGIVYSTMNKTFGV